MNYTDLIYPISKFVKKKKKISTLFVQPYPKNFIFIKTAVAMNLCTYVLRNKQLKLLTSCCIDEAFEKEASNVRHSKDVMPFSATIVN